MNTTSPKFNFSRLDDVTFLSKAKCILSCMQGKPDYPSPIPSTATIREAFKEFDYALYHENKVEYGAFLKFEKRKKLEMLLIKLPAFCSTATMDACERKCFSKEELMVA